MGPQPLRHCSFFQRGFARVSIGYFDENRARHA
jgi:hypothetical protein